MGADHPRRRHQGGLTHRRLPRRRPDLITGYQDTLFPNAGRHYFHGCTISGHVDFIFGAGQAVFDDCDIVSRDRRDASNNGYIAAPSTAMRRPSH